LIDKMDKNYKLLRLLNVANCPNTTCIVTTQCNYILKNNTGFNFNHILMAKDRYICNLNNLYKYCGNEVYQTKKEFSDALNMLHNYQFMMMSYEDKVTATQFFVENRNVPFKIPGVELKCIANPNNTIDVTLTMLKTLFDNTPTDKQFYLLNVIISKTQNLIDSLVLKVQKHSESTC